MRGGLAGGVEGETCGGGAADMLVARIFETIDVDKMTVVIRAEGEGKGIV